MRIISFNIANNTTSTKTGQKSYAPTFGEYENFGKIAPNPNLFDTSIYNFSGVFRDGKFWDEFTDYIVQKHQNGVKIHSAAGSNASEAYTIIMKLLDNNEQSAKKYLPIKVTDICPTAIEDIKTKEIYLSEREQGRMEAFLSNKKSEDFFEVLPDGDYNHETHTFKGHNYTIKKVLHSNIKPAVADIFKEIKKPENFQEPTVLLLRNCWYQFKKKIKDLYKKLKPTSSVVIGSIDIMHDVPELFVKKGFVEINKFIFEKPLPKVR